MLIIVLLDGKLFRTLPRVFEPKERKPASAIAKHINMDTPAE
jgi:hypothetical protein